jgi:hypothetical protein
MDVLLLDCVFPEASRPANKKAVVAGTVSYPYVRHKNPTFLQTARLPSLLSRFRNLARVKQTACHRRWYIAMSSSSSAASASSADPSSEDTLSDLVATEL